MAASNIASTGIVLEVLTRDNYLDWSVLVMNYLKGKKLWKDAVEGIPDLDNEDWQSKNGQALHAIQLSCGHYTLREIRNCVTAQEAWNHLKAVFSEDLRADHFIEQGGLQSEIDMFHEAVKKGLKNDAIFFIKNDGDIISQKSPSNGWTSLHVAVDAKQDEIMKLLVNMGALLTETDWEGYTPFSLAATSNDDIKTVEWMHTKGGDGPLTMKIKADDDKGDIPVLLAARKGHKEMTRFLFSKTPWLTLLDNNCYYGSKLISHCIHAEIFDVAAALLQRRHIPLNYESHQCTRPIYGLAHIPTAFPSGTKLNWCEQIIYNVLWIPPYIDLEDKSITIKSQDGGSSTYNFAGKIFKCAKSLAGAVTKVIKCSPPTMSCFGRYVGQFQLIKHIGKIFKCAKSFAGAVTKVIKCSPPTMSCFGRYVGQFQLIKLPYIKKIYRIKKNHYLVSEILRCLREEIEKIPSESELHQWRVHDAMLQAAKYGIIEFINKMREANPDLLWGMDKYKRGIFAHAILNRQDKVFKLVYEIEGQKELKTSKDIFENNLLHLVAELGPSSYRGLRSNAALQMQIELQWFKMWAGLVEVVPQNISAKELRSLCHMAVESIVPPMYTEAKNADGLTPRELFTKNHEHLVNEGRQWAKDTASSFTIVGTLIITIMFAAAFTVPGGNNQDKGLPIFLGKNAFSLFIMADALSLIASSSSVLMFIGILTSRYAEEDFVTSLPTKLLFGLFTIFLSVVFMMCAFCSALALMLKGYRWIIIAAIASSVIPILVFMFTLLRIFLEVCVSSVKSPFHRMKKDKII